MHTPSDEARDEPEIERTIMRSTGDGSFPKGQAAGERSAPSDRPLDVDKTLSRPVPKQTPGQYVPTIPDVSISGTLGTGGQGVVFRGHQEYLDRPVAVKVLHRHVDPSFSKRFQREAKILAGLSHPNIVACHQAGVTDDDHCYMVMEFIDGPDLFDRVNERGPLEPDVAIKLVTELARALKHGQESAIIHRDVKPQNVLCQEVSGAGFRAKLADLGLARCSEESAELPQLTTQGSVMGTPTTMAPEQFDAPDEVDHRADIYGLGCVLFFALTGKSAFEGTTITEIYRKKTAREMPRMFAKEELVPAAVQPLLVSMMAAEPKGRPADYDELIAALEAVAKGQKPSLKTPTGDGANRTMFAGVALLFLAGAGFMAKSLFAGNEAAPDPSEDVTAERGDKQDGVQEPKGSAAAITPASTTDEGDADAPNTTSEPDADAESPSKSPVDAERKPLAFMPSIRKDSVKQLFAGAEKAADILSDWERNTSNFHVLDSDVEMDVKHVRCRADEDKISWAKQPVPEGAWRLTGRFGVETEFGAFERPLKAGIGLIGDADRTLYFGVVAKHENRKALSAYAVVGWGDIETCGVVEEIHRVDLELGEGTVEEVAATRFTIERDADGTMRVSLQSGDPIELNATEHGTDRLNELRLTTCNGIGSWSEFEYVGR